MSQCDLTEMFFMLKSHCSSQLVLLEKMVAVNLFIILEENVFLKFLTTLFISVFFMYICFVLFFYVLGKRNDKNERKVI